MSDDDDHQVGRQVVGPVSGEIEAADRAVVVDFEKRTIQATAPAEPKRVLKRIEPFLPPIRDLASTLKLRGTGYRFSHPDRDNWLDDLTTNAGPLARGTSPA